MSAPEAVPQQTRPHAAPRSRPGGRRRPAHMARRAPARTTGPRMLGAPAPGGESIAILPPAHLARALPPRSATRSARLRLAVKAVVDRVGAAALLVLLAPVLLAVGAIVRVTSRGPAVYRQERVGHHGETFLVLKFRTMEHDAERRQRELAHRNEADGLLFKVHDDPRVTRFGRFLRRSSLDELPQLWNIVVGEMSLVGPRPLPVRPEAIVGAERRRLDVRPGLTGLAQVSGRSDLCWADTVRLDVEYVETWSLHIDLLLLARTPLAVLRGRGAY